jgi:hypothetical protein
VVACYINNPGAAFGMAQYTPDHIGMALLPTPFVLLNLPSINDIAYKI